jgi:hypothetical protein
MENNILINNKALINQLTKTAMSYAPAFELDHEINQLSNTYYSTIMSILHFGEGELNFRKGERYSILNLYPDLVTYSNNQLTEWNNRGISSLDVAIQTIEDFITSGISSNTPIPSSNYDDMRLRISQILVETHLSASDVNQLVAAFDEVVTQAANNGELGVVTFMRDKLIELKNVRLSPTRGTEVNSIPVWKIIGAIIIFGFPVYKTARCLIKGKCCNTVSGLEGLIVFIAAVAWVLCD